MEWVTMQAQAVPKRDAVALPEDLETSEAKLVYLALSSTPAETVDDLQNALDMQKLSLFQLLSTLSSAGLVESDDHGRYTTC